MLAPWMLGIVAGTADENNMEFMLFGIALGVMSLRLASDIAQFTAAWANQSSVLDGFAYSVMGSIYFWMCAIESSSLSFYFFSMPSIVVLSPFSHVFRVPESVVKAHNDSIVFHPIGGRAFMRTAKIANAVEAEFPSTDNAMLVNRGYNRSRHGSLLNRLLVRLSCVYRATGPFVFPSILAGYPI